MMTLDYNEMVTVLDVNASKSSRGIWTLSGSIVDSCGSANQCVIQTCIMQVTVLGRRVQPIGGLGSDRYLIRRKQSISVDSTSVLHQCHPANPWWGLDQPHVYQCCTGALQEMHVLRTSGWLYSMTLGKLDRFKRRRSLCFYQQPWYLAQ